MPILGVIASSFLQSTDLGAFVPIATTTLASNASSITFSSIPATYTHLQLRGNGRSTTAGSAQDELQLSFNGVSGSSYAFHFIYGNSASVVASGGASQSYIRAGFLPRASATANVFGSAIIDIFDYASTSKNKTIRSFAGADLNDSNSITAFCSGLFMSLSAITSITLRPESGNNFPANSSYSLYGIKG
jgi:hypothetical protein